MQFALELMDGTVFGTESEYGTGFAQKSPRKKLKVVAALAGQHCQSSQI